MEIFKDRKDAGEKLARRLLKYKEDSPLILALPRGGVPVGYEVAKALKAPLDTLVVRKVGAPFNPEYGVGAIAPGDVIVSDMAAIQSLGISKEVLDPIIAEEMREMDRRMVHYKSGEYSHEFETGTIIIVDDGLATGVSARAAIESAKILQKPKKLVFASPVCARDSADMIRGLVDEVVCMTEVDNLVAIAVWYEQFKQTTDEEVLEYLERAKEIRT